MPTLAVTGGTGFVGGHLLKVAAEQGFRVRALARRPQPSRDGVEWIEGALDNLACLQALCAGADMVIHVAGVVNARRKAEFQHCNELGTGLLASAAEQAGVRRFLLVSSLAAREPSLSVYGASKAGGEAIVRASGLDWTILRPPAVYGPGDTEMFALFQMAEAGIAFIPSRGRFSVIEVSDLARALLAFALAPAAARQMFEIDDGTTGGFDHADFLRLIGAALERRPRIVRVAPSALKLAAVADTAVARLSRRLPRLSLDRARYFAHPDWVARPLAGGYGGIWQPRIAAPEGLAATAAWYRAQGWLSAR